MECCDGVYNTLLPFRLTVKNKALKAVMNEKQIFTAMTKYKSWQRPVASCSNANGEWKASDSCIELADYFKKNKDSLFVDCVKKGGYSYCQQYYTFVFNSTSLQCQPFKRQPCPVLSFSLHRHSLRGLYWNDSLHPTLVVPSLMKQRIDSTASIVFLSC